MRVVEKIADAQAREVAKGEKRWAIRVWHAHGRGSAYG